ncbi:hypothetical protein GWI33_015823 [Rhynchophorus ferrugineus]|uniref:Uncharacterized protein n=1 Tax=Rhynchophorus ferrugineus TaxID=354439 RepID=A0A834ICF4_RHYFE|nr:hypothetical protein GWI33_015823 [Rhynchophorus ferrugineus]
MGSTRSAIRTGLVSRNAVDAVRTAEDGFSLFLNAEEGLIFGLLSYISWKGECENVRDKNESILGQSGLLSDPAKLQDLQSTSLFSEQVVHTASTISPHSQWKELVDVNERQQGDT